MAVLRWCQGVGDHRPPVSLLRVQKCVALFFKMRQNLNSKRVIYGHVHNDMTSASGGLFSCPSPYNPFGAQTLATGPCTQIFQARTATAWNTFVIFGFFSDSHYFLPICLYIDAMFCPHLRIYCASVSHYACYDFLR